VFGDADDKIFPVTGVQLQNDDSQVVLTTVPPPTGTYQLRLNAPAITDRVGHPLGDVTANTYTVSVLLNKGGMNFGGATGTFRVLLRYHSPKIPECPGLPRFTH
jgi:hypothetical protein